MVAKEKEMLLQEETIALKLTDHNLKIAERVFEKLIGQQVDIDVKQFAFMPRYVPANAIFNLRWLRKEYFVKKKNLYFVFVNWEKALDRVPSDVVWWAMRKRGAEWMVESVQSMYSNA